MVSDELAKLNPENKSALRNDTITNTHKSGNLITLTAQGLRDTVSMRHGSLRNVRCE